MALKLANVQDSRQLSHPHPPPRQPAENIQTVAGSASHAMCVFTCKCVNQSALFLSCLSPVCAQVIDIYCIIYILYMANNVFSLTNMSVDLKSDFSYIVLSLSFILQFCLFILK